MSPSRTFPEGSRSPSAAVWEATGRFQHKQALLGRCREHATPAGFFHQRVEIHSWIKTEDRELKPVLARLFPMATTAVAPQLREERNHIVFEMHERVRRDSCDGQRHARLCLAIANDDRALPVAQAPEQRPGKIREPVLLQAKLALARDVEQPA